MARVSGSSSPGSPGFLGALEDAADAVRKTFGPAHGKPPVGVGGQQRDDAITRQVDSVAGDESNHSSTVASNAGVQAQSTDHYNNY